MCAVPVVMPALSTDAVLLQYRRRSDQDPGGAVSLLPLSDEPSTSDDRQHPAECEEIDVDDYSVREGPLSSFIAPQSSSHARDAAKKRSIEEEEAAPSLQVDWDKVNFETLQRTTMEKNRADAVANERQKTVTFLGAARALKDDTSAWEPYVFPQRFNATKKENCLMALLLWCVSGSDGRAPLSTKGNGNDEDPDHVLQRDAEFTSTLPSVPFDHSHIIHRQLLVTIHNSLLRRTSSNSANSSHIGAIDWEKLGFQGSDPATDLRSTGIFGLLQLVYLIEYYCDFAIHLWDTCTNGGSDVDVFEELPFVLIGFNFSAVVLDGLKDTGFSSDIMRHARSTSIPRRSMTSLSLTSDDMHAVSCEFPVLKACCNYHVGCLFLFWEWWLQLRKQRGGRPPTIGDFGVVKAKLCAKIKKNGTQYVFDACARARDPAVVASLAADTDLDTEVKLNEDAVTIRSN